MMTKNCAMTHGGKFHADDVFSAALLKIWNPDLKIIRAFTVPETFDGLIFDIGWGKFDHHQKNALVRENGVPYASFGLLWEEYGERILRAGFPPDQAKKEAEYFDFKFIQPLDEDDNTGCGNPIASIIESFNPNWDSDKPADLCFAEAVQFASVILNKKLDHMFGVQRAKELVKAALTKAKDGIVILPKFAPWKAVLAPSDAEFVIYPSQRGGFSAQIVPADPDFPEAKQYFPLAWAGKPEEELKRISGIETLRFCHNGRFLISTGNLEDAVKACKKAKKQRKD
ncbi:MAG: MYG1 family protein [Oscillospiraceae bacterium]|nr:MYG1 family protein [Oscillospiraceae bacterium]